MASYRLAGIIIASATVLQGCETLPCTGDPATDPYHCASANLSEGVYQRQLDDLVARRVRLEENRTALERNQRELDIKLASTRKANSELSAAIKTIDARILELNSHLTQLNEDLEVASADKQDAEAAYSKIVEAREALTLQLFDSDLSQYSEDEVIIINSLKSQISDLEAELTRKLPKAVGGEF